MGRVSKNLNLDYTLVDDYSNLSDEEQTLVRKAEEAQTLSYAPYSKFRVGAAAILDNGIVMHASNKENASFPAGICAERNLLNTISDTYPNARLTAMAVIASTMEFELSDVLAPCGICRQVLCETEKVQGISIKMIFKYSTTSYVVIDGCENLLPFHFYLSELKR
tara:strand:+ start:405 stop:899 length:495 start_codon:yes stop_codon:yes gene_type:complete